MNSCLTPAEIERLVTGQCSAEERGSAEAHLRTCALCRARRDGLGSSASNADGTHAVAATVTTDATEDIDPTTESGTSRPDDLIPTIPGYRMIEHLGEGGQGQVFKAMQASMGRIVALKIMRARSADTPSAVETFRREVELVAQLRHPGIVTVYESGMFEGRRYYSMEFIAGVPLAEHIASHRPAHRELLALFQSIAAAVGFAHRRGIVHRDLKPGNVCIDLEGRPRILDFGLAKAMWPLHTAEEDITRTGEFKGTLAYASPEQTRGELRRIDARSDVYALGVMLYEALTGGRPHAEAMNLTSMLESISEHTPAAPSKVCPGIDRDVDTIVMTALAKEPERRYATAAELADDIGRYLEGLPLRARPEGIGYRVRKHLRRAATRHPAVTMILIPLLACVGSQGVLRASSMARHPDRLFESAVQTIARYRLASGWPDEILVVGLDDETYGRIPQLAETLELEGVRQDRVTSWRKLHAALMERLATARPAVVAWDIVFGSEQPEYDDALARGIEALRAVGSRVVVGVKEVDARKRPALTPAVAERVDGWGWIKLADLHGMVRGTLLALNDPPQPPSPSLSLAAVCAFQHAQATPHFTWDVDAPALLVHYSRRLEDGDIEYLPDFMVIPASDIETEPAFGAGGTEDVPRLRWAAWTWTVLPSVEVVAAHTVAYHDVFALGPAELERRFQGRLVIVGDNRERMTSRPDKGLLDDGLGGREDFHCYVHASAIADRLGAVALRRPRIAAAMSVALVAGGLGAVTGRRFAARLLSARFWIAGVALSLAGVALAVVIAATCGIIASPSGFLMAFWFAALGAGWALRTRP